MRLSDEILRSGRESFQCTMQYVPSDRACVHGAYVSCLCICVRVWVCVYVGNQKEDKFTLKPPILPLVLRKCYYVLKKKEKKNSVHTRSARPW